MPDFNEQNQHMPVFLREMLSSGYGAEAEKIFAGFGAERVLSFRANTLKTTAEAVAETLEKEGISYRRVPWYADAFVLNQSEGSRITKLPLYERGEIYLQSLSSMLPPLVLKPQAGERILDMTAAPGGKTTQMAALSDGGALITACERENIRFQRLKYNLNKQGASRVNAMQQDASKLDEFFRFDKILLDAPCSGSGTYLENQPSKISEKLMMGCIKQQKALLCKALKLLKEGGTLLYSTCSLFKQENELMVESALKGTGCKLVPIEEDFLSQLPLLSGREGTVTVCPNEEFEGFFLAKIQK